MQHVHSGMDLPGSAPETGCSPQNCCSESLQEHDSSAGNEPGQDEPSGLLLPAHNNVALTALGSIRQKMCTCEKTKQVFFFLHKFFKIHNRNEGRKFGFFLISSKHVIDKFTLGFCQIKYSTDNVPVTVSTHIMAHLYHRNSEIQVHLKIFFVDQDLPGGENISVGTI